MIIEFEDEDSYNSAQQILIQMHEENPPPRSQYKPFHYVRDEEAEEVIKRLKSAQIPHAVVDI